MINSLPNIITIIRMMASLAVPIMIMSNDAELRLAAVIIFASAALTDWLDGYLARQLNAVSTLGRMLDPVADKLLVAGSILALAAADDWGMLLFIPALAILLREVFISGLREFMASENFVIHVTLLAKFKTTFQLIGIGFAMATPLTPPSWQIETITITLIWIAGVMTVITGWDYLSKAIKHDSTS